MNGVDRGCYLPPHYEEVLCWRQLAYFSAMQDPTVQLYTSSNSVSNFHFCAVLFNFELFALETILHLLIFMF